MTKLPFIGFPYRYPYPRYYPYRNTISNKNENSKTSPDVYAAAYGYSKNSNTSNKTVIEKSEESINLKSNSENRQAKNHSRKSTPQLPFSLNMDGFSDLEQPIIEILGIKLYQDDLIILGLLFFLYKEEVKDESLFVSLILLLLS